MTLDGSPIALSMLQVNVALGLVYLGLREFRYKRFLADEVWRAFTDSGCDDIRFSSSYTDLLNSDERFAKGHHYLTRLASSLLLDKLSESWKSNLKSRKSSGALKWPSRAVVWYMGWLDKVAIFVVMIASPIVVLWYNPLVDYTWVLLLVGQLLIVAHILVFWFVVKSVGRRVRRLGGYVVKHWTNAEAKALFNKFKETLPT